MNAISSETSIHKQDLLSDTNLLNRFSFELQGGELINGRKAFIVDFKPVSPRSTRTDFERPLSQPGNRTRLGR